jgi:hypothetical protein
MTRVRNWLVAAVAVVVLGAVSAGCHRGAVVNPASIPGVGGTISGLVTASGGSVALSGRKVTAIEVRSNQRHETTTATNGGYTMQVPTGTYRLELELRTGESLTEQPGETEVNNSDLDSGRNFVVTVSR